MSVQKSERQTGLPREESVEPEPSFIQVKNLTKVFQLGKTSKLFRSRIKKSSASGFVAVDDVSFEVKRGQIFVIMGLSGSGKSTIVRMVNRLIDASHGSVVVDGKDVGA